MDNRSSTPILFPYDPETFWQTMHEVIEEEVTKATARINPAQQPAFETPGMTYKPLYKMQEVCSLFKVTKPAI